VRNCSLIDAQVPGTNCSLSLRCSLTVQAVVPVADGHDHGASQFEATLDAVEQLRSILRDEHSLLTQYKMIIWGRVLTPVQVSRRSLSAVHTVRIGGFLSGPSCTFYAA